MFEDIHIFTLLSMDLGWGKVEIRCIMCQMLTSLSFS